MGFRSDERAQSTLVGAILLFAILIIAFSSYQAFVVPNQNAEVEFNHNGDVQTDMQELRNSLLDVRSVERFGKGEYTVISEHRSVRIRLGTQYPARLIALNPPAPSGELRTEESQSEFRIENAGVNTSKIDSEFHEDPEKLLGTDPAADMSTNFLIYNPVYTEYQTPPTTVLEHSFMYNEFQNARIPVTQQTVIRPNATRINIVLLEGNLSRSGSQAISIDPQTLDGPTDTVPINRSGTDPITVQIPTRSPTAWNSTIQSLDGVDFETPPDPDDDDIRVTLANDSYNLRVTRVGVDNDAQVNDKTLTPMQIEGQGAVGGPGGSDTYDVVSVDPQTPGGNDIEVTFEIDTTDPNAQVNVQSLDNDGTVRDSTGIINVDGTQPQTENIQGANQASEVRVILYDSNGVEQDRRTEPI
ncbi:hypothetical protein [Natronomonas sp.]|uniref:hypothetical protein n=1 Tax=Natronomonas sp. TaxID=2184060 RepID=UPI00262D52AC|nr:hypothetical protein [Natronomonas sp.]